MGKQAEQKKTNDDAPKQPPADDAAAAAVDAPAGEPVAQEAAEEVWQEDRFAYPLGKRCLNRHSSEAGVVVEQIRNLAGKWYRMATVSGMSIGIWHETDIELPGQTAAPTEHSAGGES